MLLILTSCDKPIGEGKEAGDWGTFYKLKEGIADLREPYASTVHKSQGSTYEVCFMDMGDIRRCFDRNTLARMLYVGCTRPKQKLILFTG